MKYRYSEVTGERVWVRPCPLHHRVVTLLPPSLYFLFLSVHLVILFTHLLTSCSNTRFWFHDIGHTGYRLLQQRKKLLASSTIIPMILETSFHGRIVLAYIVFIPNLYSRFHFTLPNHFPSYHSESPDCRECFPFM
jgi:hypothetical protein